jgi:hypothetical protein
MKLIAFRAFRISVNRRASAVSLCFESGHRPSGGAL